MIWCIDIETADGDNILTKFCSRNLAEVLKWWNEKWVDDFVAGRINFSVYAGNKQLTFSQAYDLGFYDKVQEKKQRRAKK